MIEADAVIVDDTLDESNSDTHRFEFRGTAAEYFRIWAVNIALSILTLGIYSAWAKVRTKRYFYGNTFLDGENFEYHANPLSILIARLMLVAVVVFGSLLAQHLGATEDLSYTIVLLLFLPWAWVRGLSFNARNSSHRNIRFVFDRAYGFPYLFYVVFITPFIVVFLPWLIRGYHRFKCARHRWGGLHFVFGCPREFSSSRHNPEGPPIWPYLVVFWLGGVVFIILLSLLSIVVFSSESDPYLPFEVGFPMMFLLMLIFYFKVQSHMLRLFWNSVRTANGATFVCEFTAREFAYSILLVNFLATMFTLGLLHPWAKVRKTRFLANRIKIIAPSGALNDIVSRRREKESAFGEEFDASEGFDFDVGII